MYENNTYSDGNTGSAQNSFYRNYDTRQEPGAPEADSKKKGARKPNFFLKALTSISLGLFFGLFAGLGFYAVQQGMGLMNPEEPVRQEEQSEAPGRPRDDFVEETNRLPAQLSTVTVVESDVTDVVEKVMPCMVSIVSNQLVSGNVFGYSYSETLPFSGSGIILGETEEELLIATNNHVVADAGEYQVKSNELLVTFIDNTETQAHVKGTDPEMDLAVIAVRKSEMSEETLASIKIATLGDSDVLQMGERVIAIGNALGFGQSVTVGYVSAVNRQVTSSDGITGNFIQTDAAINPGNSGGALLNVNGEVIGINSSKIGDTKVEGMCFAIPINDASPILSELMERKTREKVAEDEAGYMGISMQTITSDLAKAFNMPTGIYILDVEENSAAAKAGLQYGDIIIKMDGTRVTTYEDVQGTMQYFAAGDELKLQIKRAENGKYVEKEIVVTLGRKPKNNR